MRLRSKLIVFCLVCLSFLRLSAQDGRNLLLSLSPFERAVVCIKHFEGLHGFKDAPMSDMVISSKRENALRQR